MAFGGDLFGSKPTVPDLPKINLGDEQQKAISANKAALPSAQELVGKANQFSIDQITQMLEQAVPGYSKMVGTATANIASELKGEIPADVATAVRNKDTAHALGSGFGGSGMHDALTTRDLGLTSLNLTERGLSSFESWTKTAASLFEPSMLNVSSMFISPMQEYQTDNEQNVQQFQRQWMENQIKAQPAMWAQALKEAVETAISMYSHSGAGVQHAGSIPVQGSGVGGGGGGYPYSSGAGEGGAEFDPYSTQFNDSSGGGAITFGGDSNMNVGGAAEGVTVAG